MKELWHMMRKTRRVKKIKETEVVNFHCKVWKCSWLMLLRNDQTYRQS